MPQSMRRLVLAAILAVVVLLFTAPVQRVVAELSAAQESATLAFLQEFPSEFRVLRDSWTGTGFCSWTGVTCDNTTNEVAINLSGRGLTGSMPEVPSDVTYSNIMVTSIDMSNNPDWNEQFESRWGRLSNLRVLDLRNTALYGSIPDNWNGMTSLEEVHITNTYSCQRLPNWNIASLRILDLSNNNLRGSLPPLWSAMTALEEVNIGGNNVCGCVPSTWTSAVLTNAAAAIGNGVSSANCATANTCDHRSDHCIQYDRTFSGLTLTQRHTLAFLQKFPREIRYLQSRWTGTDYCSWEGVTCDAATGDVSIDLSGKGLTGDMPQIDSRVDGWLVRVVSIDMSNNPSWRDDFESDWGQLRNVKFLNLSYTALKDDIPDDWTGMTSLEEVYITNTGACKSLPAWSIRTLRVVDFSNNNLQGSLAPSWSAMTSLTSVNFAGNAFCGCVPSTWTAAVLTNAVSGFAAAASDCSTSNACTYSNLRCWSSNVPTSAPGSTASATLRFLQSFPNSLTRLSWTGTDYCSWDGVTCDADGYVVVDLSNRGISGFMPQLNNRIDGSQVMVVSISLANNAGITGNFRDNWAALRNLRSLDLSGTGLYGNIPDAWNGMAALEEVRISNTGACRGLPNWNIATLTTAVVSNNNNLRGSLANSWSSMTRLSTVDLTGNAFCGCVPGSWRGVTVLSNAAAAIGGNLTSANCATNNVCTGNSFRCANGAGLPAQAAFAVAAALAVVLSALAL